MTKSSPWSRRNRGLAASLLCLCGCEQGTPQEPGGEVRCEWIETEVALDFRPDSRVPSPAEFLEAVERPYRGELTWLGGSPWVQMEPVEASTRMTSLLSHRGRTVFRRVLNEDGSDAVEGTLGWSCFASYEIDAEIRISTDDRVLDETWVATVSHKFLNNETTAHVDLDQSELREKLRIQEVEDPPIPFENGRLDLALVYVLRQPPDEGEARGTLFYSGDLGSSTENGGVMEESGFSVGLFEWKTVPDG